MDSGGCSGFQYAFEIEKGPDYENEDDHFFGHDEESRPAVVIDDVSLEFVKGTYTRVSSAVS